MQRRVYWGGSEHLLLGSGKSKNLNEAASVFKKFLVKVASGLT